MSEKLKSIESILNTLTKDHKPELGVAYTNAGGQKLRNGDINTNGVLFFKEDTAEAIYNFMRHAIGKDPLAIK